jgi:hypothetical protein
VLAYEQGKRTSMSASTTYILAVAEATDASLGWLMAGRWTPTRMLTFR